MHCHLHKASASFNAQNLCEWGENRPQGQSLEHAGISVLGSKMKIAGLAPCFC